MILDISSIDMLVSWLVIVENVGASGHNVTTRVARVEGRMILGKGLSTCKICSRYALGHAAPSPLTPPYLVFCSWALPSGRLPE